ncbi:hypothetical protein ACFSYH_04510 [Populibacterium corticicola]|jgi:hypothetical protein|uniref:Uncharacterized protein n=1 Tax=Populibacterium corticicola TaxID=1812826 RepID=A0ABW5XEX5_9MICO
MSTKKNHDNRTTTQATGQKRAAAPQKEELSAGGRQQRFAKIVAIAVVAGLVLSMVVPAVVGIFA